MSDKPTIHELEKILEEGDREIFLNPDGSVAESDTWEKRAKAAEEINADLLEALQKLATAEKEYRFLHDHMGADRPETGRAWDLMRRAGDQARDLIAIAKAEPHDD